VVFWLHGTLRCKTRACAQKTVELIDLLLLLEILSSVYAYDNESCGWVISDDA
jgi:hypothetical protein